MKPILEIEGVYFSYRDETVLKDVCLTVSPGELVSIIGPNGSGKTTLIKTVSGAILPRKGCIRLQGTDIRGMSGNRLARTVSVVHQVVSPVSMTVENYVRLGRLPHFRKFQFFESRADRVTADKYLRLTGIQTLKDARMTEISGGEKQLASIARALTQEPSLLILDEPTSHLDIGHQAKILDLVGWLKQRLSLTVIMVQHDLNLAAQYSDRLVLLNKQTHRIHRTGPPEIVLTRQAIMDVYQTQVKIGNNPASDRPCVFPDTSHRCQKEDIC